MPDRSFYGFEEPTEEAWLEKVKKDLKSKSLDDYLLTDLEGGIKIKALHFPSEQPTAIVGAFPFTRGIKSNNNAYEIEQSFSVKDEKKANKQILESLKNGGQAISFVDFDENTDVEILLKDVEKDFISIGLKTVKNIKAAEVFLKYFQSQSCLNLNPFPPDSNINIKDTIELYEKTHIQNQKTFYFGMDGIGIANAGGSVQTELAYILLSAHELIHQLVAKGYGIDDISARFVLRIGVGRNYLLTIAKIRALRTLWANMIKVYQPKHGCSMNCTISGETVNWNKLDKDEDMNLLRGITEAMSAILGGVDILEINHNNMGRGSDDFRYRMSRNIHHLLQEEAYLALVADPLGGSYQLEDLTHQLIKRTWDLFRDSEAKGGIIQVKNDLKRRIKDEGSAMSHKYQDKKLTIVGGNKYNANGQEINGIELKYW